jgi:hypothetical protein
MAHGQWSEVEARGVLAAWQKSGLTIERFARDRGITPQRIHWWKKKLSTSQERPLALLPVQVADTSKRGEPVKVLLRSGHMLKVGRGFDEEAFVRIVAILEGT